MNIRRIAAAAGFATGAALAFAPLALADSSSDAASTADSLISGLSPAATTPINLDISFDGYTLYDGGGTATATTVSGEYGFAVAYGAGANATAEGGIGDVAYADGTDALARAGSTAAGATGNNYDYAEDVGNNAAPSTGYYDGAYAGNGSLIGGTDDTATSSNDTAIEFGNNTNSATVGGNEGAFAGSGHLIGSAGAGNGDTAIDVGNEEGADNGPAAVAGNDNYASDSGNEDGQGVGALAGFGNSNSATVDGGTSGAQAGGEYTSGAATPTADLGNNDVATVYDPSGTVGSDAYAGFGDGVTGNSDFAAVFGVDGVTSNAVGADFLYDIISLFGNNAGSYF